MSTIYLGRFQQFVVALASSLLHCLIYAPSSPTISRHLTSPSNISAAWLVKCWKCWTIVHGDWPNVGDSRTWLALASNFLQHLTGCSFDPVSSGAWVRIPPLPEFWRWRQLGLWLHSVRCRGGASYRASSGPYLSCIWAELQWKVYCGFGWETVCLQDKANDLHNRLKGLKIDALTPAILAFLIWKLSKQRHVLPWPMRSYRSCLRIALTTYEL